MIFIIAIYLVITFILTAIGFDKNSEGLKIFLISLLLTPVVGFFYMLKERRKVSNIKYYYCSECDYIFPVKMTHCPICEEQHKKIRLTKYKSPIDVSQNVGTLSLV